MRRIRRGGIDRNGGSSFWGWRASRKIVSFYSSTGFQSWNFDDQLVVIRGIGFRIRDLSIWGLGFSIGENPIGDSIV